MEATNRKCGECVHYEHGLCLHLDEDARWKEGTRAFSPACRHFEAWDDPAVRGCGTCGNAIPIRVIHGIQHIKCSVPDHKRGECSPAHCRHWRPEFLRGVPHTTMLDNGPSFRSERS